MSEPFTLASHLNLNSSDISSVELLQETQVQNKKLQDRSECSAGIQELKHHEKSQLNDDNDIDIELGEVKDLQKNLKNYSYENIRKFLFKKYGLVSKDEKTLPNLYMITYNKPDRISNKHKLNLSKEMKNIISKYRGVIVEKKTNRPVCYTFDRMIKNNLPNNWNLKECHITKSYDGSQIKLFYNSKSDKWIVSTTRRIDASNAYFFSKKSFLEMFDEAKKNYNFQESKLNKECCYSLILGHPENRVVAKHTNPSLTHVLTRNMKTFELVDEDIGLPKPEKLTSPTFMTKTGIWKKIKDLSEYQEGYVVMKDGLFVKMVNSKYDEIKIMRGSSNSLLYHYLVLKKNGKRRKFLQHFPEYQAEFKTFDNNYLNTCLVIFNEYILFRVRQKKSSSNANESKKKEKIISNPDDLLPFCKTPLFELHGIHIKENRKKITFEIVNNTLSKYEPYKLRQLIEATNQLSYKYF